MAYLDDVSHPEVIIDPDVPVPDWVLSEPGRKRAQALVRQPWVESVGRVVSSPETKARETTDVFGGHVGLSIEVRPATGELDRSSTGHVPRNATRNSPTWCSQPPTEVPTGGNGQWMRRSVCLRSCPT